MINFVVALACEAKPLIKSLKLNNVANPANFPLYENKTFRLIISGVGKLNAAIATSYAASLGGFEKNQVWLNVGIAGHCNADIGTPIIANKITDGGSDLSWHPIFITTCTVQSCTLITHEHPQTEYAADTMYDMEAAGFYLAASRFNTTEFIHSLKIVSDNPKTPAKTISEKDVKQLMLTNLDIIEQNAWQLNESAQQWRIINHIPEDMAQFLSKWHFTVYQQNQLKQLLRRCNTLFDQQAVWTDELHNLTHSKHVLRYIEQKIKQFQFETPVKD